MLPCNVCYETKKVSAMYTFQPCIHSYCTEVRQPIPIIMISLLTECWFLSFSQCICDYLKTKILNNDCVDIHCMYPKCQTIIQYHEIQELVDPELFAKYEEFSLQVIAL